MTLTAITERGVFSITTNTAEFDYIKDGTHIRVSDARGNSAALDFDLGCVGSTGLGSCSLIGTVEDASRFAGTVNSAPNPEGVSRDNFIAFDPSDGFLRRMAPIRIMAATSVSCPGPGGDVFDISTGTSSGTCTPTYDEHGNATGGTCDDGSGNTSGVNCALNGGAGGCTPSTGSGTCKVR
jgi:hypothetical protein